MKQTWNNPSSRTRFIKPITTLCMSLPIAFTIVVSGCGGMNTSSEASSTRQEQKHSVRDTGPGKNSPKNDTRSICAPLSILEFDPQNPQDVTRRKERASLEELVSYMDSDYAVVRMQVVRDLQMFSSSRTRMVFEEIIQTDSNKNVRFAAIDALQSIGSVHSIKALNKAHMSATQTDERAKLKKAIAVIRKSHVTYEEDTY